MLKTSLTLVTQLLIDLADNHYDRINYREDEAGILSISSAFKKSTGVGFKTSTIKKIFNLLRHALT